MLSLFTELVGFGLEEKRADKGVGMTVNCCHLACGFEGRTGKQSGGSFWSKKETLPLLWVEPEC